MRKQCTDRPWPKFHLSIVVTLQGVLFKLSQVKDREAEGMITLLNFLVVNAKGCNWTIYANGQVLTDGGGSEISNSQAERG